MYITLGSYLEHLAEREQTKPETQRRPVPTMKEIAEAIGYNPVSMSKLATGKIKSLNFELGAAIIDEVRRRGFEMDVNDLLTYEPAAHEEAA